MAITIILIYMVASYYLFLRSYTNNSFWTRFLSSEKKLNRTESLILPSTFYSLDTECEPDSKNASSYHRGKEFNNIFETGRWSITGSRSGPGSTLEGAYDWLRHLRTLFKHYSIRSVADIPCGDTYWQFSLREINGIEQLYFGGDISTSVIKQNQRLYGSKHSNKLFRYWDLVNCSVPTYTYKNATHEVNGNRFDLIIVRDALQHMHIRNGLKAVRNVIMSGAKFFAVSSYPPNRKASAPNTRSLEANESLPSMPVDCSFINYCSLGQIEDGGSYENNINCHPFNFPLDKAILVQPSHLKFPMEYDEIHIYKIDDQFKKIVEQYDKACPSNGT